MEHKITIPTQFLTNAKKLGVPKDLATQFFHRKVHKKGYEDIRETLAYNGAFNSPTEAAKVLLSLWKTYRNEESFGLDSTPFVKEVEPVTGKTYLDSAREGLENLIGKLHFPGFDKNKKCEKDRVIVFSDCHIPFANEQTLAKVLSDPAEECWVLGDLIDALAVTSYRASIGTEHISLKEELAQGRAFLEELSKRFKRVKILKNSNHPDRAAKRVQSVLPSILPLLVNPMDLLAVGLNNVDVITTSVPNTSPSVKHGQNIEVGWLSKQGDVLCSHAENFCTADGVKQLDTWMSQWGNLIGVEDYRVLLHAHTHTLGKSFTHNGKLLVNTGSCCKIMPYMLENFGRFNPPVNGYIALYQKEGKTDLNSVEVVYTG